MCDGLDLETITKLNSIPLVPKPYQALGSQQTDYKLIEMRPMPLYLF